MRLTVKLFGDGTADSPYHPSLPTYSMLECDHDKMVALVDVPDSTVPDEFRDHDAWHAHLDKMYQEHAGEFRPKLA